MDHRGRLAGWVMKKVFAKAVGQQALTIRQAAKEIALQRAMGARIKFMLSADIALIGLNVDICVGIWGLNATRSRWIRAWQLKYWWHPGCQEKCLSCRSAWPRPVLPQACSPSH